MSKGKRQTRAQVFVAKLRSIDGRRAAVIAGGVAYVGGALVLGTASVVAAAKATSVAVVVGGSVAMFGGMAVVGYLVAKPGALEAIIGAE